MMFLFNILIFNYNHIATRDLHSLGTDVYTII